MIIKKLFTEKIIMILICFIVILLPGCNALEKSTVKELKVITELDYKAHVEEAAEYMMKKKPEIKIEIEYISKEKEERDNQIKKLRTQIMAEKGPDIYLLKNPKADVAESPAPLFENPYKTMQSGALASLEPYMKQDTYWKNGTYKKELLEAGQYQERQYMIPLSCYYEVLASEDDDIEYLSDMDLGQWYEESKVSDHAHLKYLMQGRNMVAESWIKEAVDYENKEIYFDCEKWENFYMQCIPGKSGQELSGGPGVLTNDMVGIKAIEIVPDLEGKKKAAVQAFGAVSMRSDYKEEAYQFIMLFLNDEMRTDAREQNKGTVMDTCIDTELPVQESAIQGWVSETGLEDSVADIMTESFRELEGAYFQTETERTLNLSVFEQSLRSDDPRIDMSAWKENAGQLSQKAWNSYQMQVLE